MAKKAFFSNKTKRDRTETARKIDSKNKRKYYLIVCEGEKTEPNYFKSLKNALPKGVLEICAFSIDGTGYNTESLVKKGIELKQAWENNLERTVDKLWVVFDKDSFRPEAFNNAIQLCLNNQSHIEAAWTNEAFELWYLLHFHFYNTDINRKQYQDLIEGNFKKKGLNNYPHLFLNNNLLYGISLTQSSDTNEVMPCWIIIYI